MYALVVYKDNTMEDYDILVKSDDFSKIEKILHKFRFAFSQFLYKPIFRIVRIE